MADPRGDITKYLGVEYAFAPTYVRDRAPLTTDIQDDQALYKIPSIWIHETGNNPIDNDVYILVDISAVTGTLEATWLLFTGGSGGSVTKLRADDGNIAVPSVGIIDIDGNTVANATHATPLFTRANIANTVDIDIQVGAAVTSPGTINDAGIVSFDDTQFSVSALGHVTLLGGGMAFDEINVDAFTAPGTNPVVPNPVTGEVTISGAAVAQHAVPVETHSRAANAFNIEVQQATAVTATPGDNTAIGLASFNDAHFTVDATSGMVSLIGGGVAADQFLTDDGAPAVVPDGAGEVDILGGTNISTAGQGPGNTITINATGLASFNWVVEIGATRNLNNNQGVFGNRGTAQTFTLPATASVGDTIRVVQMGAGNITIDYGVGQLIHFGNTDATTGTGSIVSTDVGDAVELVCNVADTEWHLTSAVGNWNVL